MTVYVSDVVLALKLYASPSTEQRGAATRTP